MSSEEENNSEENNSEETVNHDDGDKKRGKQEEDDDAKGKEEEEEEPPEKKPKKEEEEGVKCEEVEKKQKSPELLKLWKVVEDDPSDFNGWTYLLQHADAGSDVDHAREAYDVFLDRYPYCYGYWKKYADLEKRKGSGERCVAVFERGLAAIPLSSDLWIHYLNHVRDNEHSEDAVRSSYERSVAACGRDWRSDKLWDHYVKWETKEKRFRLVLNLYDRILQNQTQGLNHQFDMFREFVKDHEPKDVLEESTFLELRKEVLKSLKEEDVSKESENQAMRESIIFERRKAFKETEEKVQARWKYEDNVKRPYFHVKPLERGQLKNWNEYLAEESSKPQVDVAHVEVLFERCLIACALYEEFWLRYVRWLESLPDNNVDKIRTVYARACRHHLPDKLDIRLAWAEFEERHGHPDEAARILGDAPPDNVVVTLRRANLERRRGNHAVVHDLYRSAIAKAAGVEMSIKYARYLRLVLDDDAAAIKVLEDAIAKDESNAKLYLQLIDVQVHRKPPDVDAIVSVFNSASSCDKMTPPDRILFARRKLDFLEDFGATVQQVTDARNQLEALTSTLSKNDEGAVKKTLNGNSPPTATAYSAGNSASYGAHHASQYDQYGSRYGSATPQQYPAPPTAAAAGYGQQYGSYYSNYYQQ